MEIGNKFAGFCGWLGGLKVLNGDKK